MAVMKSMLVLLSAAAGVIAQQSAYGQCMDLYVHFSSDIE